LQFSRTATKAYAGNDVELTLPASGIALHASGTGPNNTAASYSWQKISGPAAGSLSNANTANPIVLGLTAGTYIYRVTITDNIGGTQSDDVAVTVHDIQHKEAELFNASSGVTTGPTDDGGPATAVINIDPGQWMDYNITVPTAGNYFMRFRTSAFYYGAQFQVKNSSGTVLATINSYNSGSTNNYITSYRTVPLTAGAQTLRIQSTSTIQPGQSASQWYFNWLEVENNAVADAPLPVNFVLFNANCVNGGVNLLWKTAGEVNAKNYSVERSVNGRDWTSLDILPATGRQGSEQSYQFSDLAPAGNGFYRIVLNEADGRKTYSSVIRSNCGRPLNFSVYPNPVIDRAILDISLEHSTKLSVSVVDSRGAVVRQQENILPSGSNQLSINMNGLPSGSYSLMARWDGEVQTVKLIKK
jgi:hypothetical protein